MVNLEEKHKDMIKHGVIFSLTVSPESLDNMEVEEFEEFWLSYGKIIRLLSKIRARLNRDYSEPGS